jgi:hypothetical protein
MANEFTLADYEKNAPDNLNKAVARTWREASPILDMLKFKASDMLSQKFVRFNSLPTVPWRKIGESFSQLKVNPDHIEERLYFMGAKIDIPYEYVKAKGLVDQRAIQTEAILRGSAFGFNEAFFLNTPSTDEDAVVGLWYRLVNDLAAAQSIDALDIDISPDTALTTAAWTSAIIDVVENLLSTVDGNPGDKVLFMGRTLYRRFQSALRQSNLLDTTMDQIGRQFLTYGKGGPKIMEAGYKVDQATQILTDEELSDGTALTGGACSSMYCVRFGEPFLAGWCQEKPNAVDVGLTEDQVNYRTVVRFSPGLYQVSPRAIARAYGIVAA